MDAKQHLYYALGVLAYAVAKADGKVQREEQQVIHDIVAEETEHNIDFSYADIIFQIQQKDDIGYNSVYEWAMDSFETGKHHFTDEMKVQFSRVIERVAEAFPPTTSEEHEVIQRFAKDITALKVNTVIE